MKFVRHYSPEAHGILVGTKPVGRPPVVCRQELRSLTYCLQRFGMQVEHRAVWLSLQ